MKKYVKPELFYEQFELSTHIAACEIDYVDPNGARTHSNMGACAGYPGTGLGLDPNVPVFTQDGICEMVYYCYTNGVEGVNTFAS